MAAQLGEAREMVLYARYGEAIPLVDGLLARDDLLAAQRNEALEIRAILHLARRRDRQALQVLETLYGRDPNHRMIDTDVGPAVRAAFERAREAHPPLASVTIENQTSEALEDRASPSITVQLTEGADVADEIRLNYRNSSDAPFERALMRFQPREGVGRARIPMPEGNDAYTVEYFFEILAPSQAVVATLGSSEEPLSLSVPAAQGGGGAVSLMPTSAEDSASDDGGGGSVAEEWWFWTLIGVVLVGGGVTVGVLYGTGELDPVGPGTLGEGTL